MKSYCPKCGTDSDIWKTSRYLGHNKKGEFVAICECRTCHHIYGDLEESK